MTLKERLEARSKARRAILKSLRETRELDEDARIEAAEQAAREAVGRDIDDIIDFLDRLLPLIIRLLELIR